MPSSVFVDTWTDGPLAKKKKQERVIGFFWACIRRGYIRDNPTFGLRKVKVDQTPTDYFPPHDQASRRRPDSCAIDVGWVEDKAEAM
jgi:hypothetical protein